MREGYNNDVSTSNSAIQQHKEALQHLKDENSVLREMLRARGIPFESELQARKAARQKESPLSDSSAGYSSGIYQNFGQSSLTTPPATVTSGLSPQTMALDRGGTSHGGSSSGNPHYGYQSHPTSPSNMQDDLGATQSHAAVPTPALPGVFQDDPQLGIDFILA